MVKIINAQDLKHKYDNNANLCLIDVRELEEWQQAHIPRALHIPKNQLQLHAHEAIPNLTTPIYIYCHGGVRSYHAAECLISMGYLDVSSLEGGIVQWAESGAPIQAG